jgi:hypothetical protein
LGVCGRGFNYQTMVDARVLGDVVRSKKSSLVLCVRNIKILDSSSFHGRKVYRVLHFLFGRCDPHSTSLLSLGT